MTFKTISEAHRIARTHPGKLQELGGAILHLAPMPSDIVWENIPKEAAEIHSKRTFGFLLLGFICFINTIPVRCSCRSWLIQASCCIHPGESERSIGIC